MKVRAKKRGFFGGLYRVPGKPGDTFECSDKEFSSFWMEKVKRGRQPVKVEAPKDAYIPLEIPSLMKDDDLSESDDTVTSED